MNVQAKMTCRAANAQETQFNGEKGIGGLVELEAIWEGEDGQHKAYANATPWGELKLHIDNPAAFAQFKPGETYLITMEPAQ